MDPEDLAELEARQEDSELEELTRPKYMNLLIGDGLAVHVPAGYVDRLIPKCGAGVRMGSKSPRKHVTEVDAPVTCKNCMRLLEVAGEKSRQFQAVRESVIMDSHLGMEPDGTEQRDEDLTLVEANDHLPGRVKQLSVTYDVNAELPYPYVILEFQDSVGLARMSGYIVPPSKIKGE